MDRKELWAILQTRYLFPSQNQTHLYIFPGGVRQLHPEFDSALSIMLKTDPLVMVNKIKNLLMNRSL